MKLLTLEDLKDAMKEILPGCDFDEDEDGQVIIFTNCFEDVDGELVPIEEADPTAIDYLDDELELDDEED